MKLDRQRIVRNLCGAGHTRDLPRIFVELSLLSIADLLLDTRRELGIIARSSLFRGGCEDKRSGSSAVRCEGDAGGA